GFPPVEVPRQRLIVGFPMPDAFHTPRFQLTACNADGWLDVDFADAGRLFLFDDSSVRGVVTDASAARDGGLVQAEMAIKAGDPQAYYPVQLIVNRLTAEGLPEAGFGDGGRVILDIAPFDEDQMTSPIA